MEEGPLRGDGERQVAEALACTHVDYLPSICPEFLFMSRLADEMSDPQRSPGKPGLASPDGVLAPRADPVPTFPSLLCDCLLTCVPLI